MRTDRKATWRQGVSCGLKDRRQDVTTTTININAVRYVPELYPRLKPRDDVIERYRDALDRLPPIIVARSGVLVDGYHRWQAHVREGRKEIVAEDLGDIADAEILRESYRRNATHGEQLTKREKTDAATHLYLSLGGTPDDRYAEVAELLSLSLESAKKYCSKGRQTEKEQQEEDAWSLWLDCVPQAEIADRIGVEQQTISNWVQKRERGSEICSPPGKTDKKPWGNIQHFDIWPAWGISGEDDEGPDADGQQSYFGAIPPQVIENVLWLFTQPGDVLVDLFAGSGTTVEVAKRMGRRIWASDIRGNHYAPYLPIHKHDAANGWPADAPTRSQLGGHAQIVAFLDPPYWQQAQGRYSSEPGEMAEMDLGGFYEAWAAVAKGCMEHADCIAYIISPTEGDGRVTDHATDMLRPFLEDGWRVERRIIVPYSTQQATGQQVEWARKERRLLKLYRDLVVMTG